MEVIGHRHVRHFLEEVIKRETVSHAYVFSGPRHVGKTTVAANFLGSLVTTDVMQKTDDPWQLLLRYPDFFLVEREEDAKTGKQKKNISVEQIRQLRERLSLGSLLASWKIGVIMDAETLSLEAANALLKTIEEPAGKTILLLQTTSLGALPATILSRCQLIRFGLVTEQVILNGLLARGVETPLAEECALRAAGRPGVALALAADHARLVEEQEQAGLFVSMIGSPVWQRIAFAEKVAPKKKTVDAAEEALQTLSVWQQVLRDALMLSAGEPGLVHHMSVRDHLASWVSKKEKKDIVRGLLATQEARLALGENVGPRTALEHVLLSL